MADSILKVALATPLNQLFDYLAPPVEMEPTPGQRVRVPLGRGNRRVEGYCVKIFSGDDAERRRLKEVHSVVDPEPLLSPRMLQLTAWMADYYLCTWGQAIETVVPAGVREQAGTREVRFLTTPTHVAARITQLRLPPKQAAALQCLAASSRPRRDCSRRRRCPSASPGGTCSSPSSAAAPTA